MNATATEQEVVKFECPSCAQPIEGPRSMGGTEVECPTCGENFIAPNAPSLAAELAEAAPVEKGMPGLWDFAWRGAAILAGAYVLIFACQHFPRGAESAGVVASIAVSVCASYLILKGAFLAAKRIGFGISLLTVGGIILLAAWIGWQSMPGIVAGGFVAVIGAVLMLAERIGKLKS